MRSPERKAVTDGGQPTAEEVRAHLDVLLRSESLAVSDRNRRFLAYIAEETLAGRGDRIKAYNVALTAFDRTDDFDPQTDPIVRIEASRLRRALEHYYLTAGKTDPVRIGIPKGSYAAIFEYAAPDVAAAVNGEAVFALAQPGSLAPPASREWPRWWGIPAAASVFLALGLAVFLTGNVGGAPAASGPSILVLPFEASEDGDGHDFVARGITAELIGRLTPVTKLTVLGPVPGSDRSAASDFILSGSAHAVGAKVYISAALADARTGRYLWSLNAARDLGTDLIGSEAAIAGEIAAGIEPLIGSTP